jgi:hypothetical protein
LALLVGRDRTHLLSLATGRETATYTHTSARRTHSRALRHRNSLLTPISTQMSMYRAQRGAARLSTPLLRTWYTLRVPKPLHGLRCTHVCTRTSRLSHCAHTDMTTDMVHFKLSPNQHPLQVTKASTEWENPTPHSVWTQEEVRTRARGVSAQ